MNKSTLSGDNVPRNNPAPSPDDPQPNSFFARGPWFWILLALLALFPVVGLLSNPSTSSEDPAPEETTVSATPSAEPSVTPTEDPSARAEAPKRIEGGEMLTISDKDHLEYWSSVVVKVLPGKEGELTVVTRTENPTEKATGIQKGIVSKTAKVVCERFATEMTDGKTPFALLDMNGEVYASNMTAEGEITECVSPLAKSESKDDTKDDSKSKES